MNGDSALRHLRVLGAVVLLSGVSYGVVGAVIALGALARGPATVTATLVLAVAIFGGALGAAFGLIAGPGLAFGLLRRVPLVRAIGEPAFAAGATTSLVFFATPNVLIVLGLSLAAATLSAVRLWRRSPAGVSSSLRTPG
jgi:hypothetical protein